MRGCSTRVLLSILVALTLMTRVLPPLQFPNPTQTSEWHIMTVDSDGDVGEWSSLALDARGFPHISYGDGTNQNLKYAKWVGTHWQIETVDSDFNVGRFSSLYLDSRGYPHISYHDGKNERLKYARWTGVEWEIRIVDSEGIFGRMSSLVLDSNDIPHIAYHEMDPIGDLKYATWKGNHWLNETVDWLGNVGWQNSIDVDSKDRPHISYSDKSNHEIEYTRWDGKKWKNETVDSTGILAGPTLALDSTDRPHIAYSKAGEGDLMYAHFDEGKWQTQTVDWIDDVSDYPSIALDRNDYPHITHTDLTNDDLKYAWFDGTKWYNETVDSYGSVGWSSSLEVDANGYPHISYYNRTSRDLKYATKAKLVADSPPTADAGADQSVDVGEVVQFDGSGSFDPDSGWENVTIDSQGDTGGHVSIAVDKNGFSHISYFDFTRRLLMYTEWDGTKWVKRAVDLAGKDYPQTSIALDSSGYPHISYNGGDILKHAWWDGAKWSNETVDSSGIVGRYGSMALDSGDNPNIAYHDWTNGDLKYAKWNGTAWSIDTIDSSDNVGRYASMTLDANDHPHISYYDSTHGDLKYAFWNGSAWSIGVVDSGKIAGRASSIAVDSKNRPYISYQQYYDKDLRLARWNGSSWSLERVDFAGDLAYSTSLALDSNDYPHITYNDYLQGNLKYARWDGIGWWIHTVESDGDVGGSTSIAIDENDSSHIAYYDKTNGNLNHVKKSGGGLIYDWDFGDGSPHGSGVSPTHVYTAPASYIVSLIVTDEDGRDDSDDCIVTVVDSNQPPVADASGPYYVDEGISLDLDGGDSFDPDNDTLYFRWDLDNDAIWDTSWSASPEVSNTWMDNGTYTVVLQVMDTSNMTDSDKALVYVEDLGPAAGFSWSPDPQDEGSQVQFTDMSTSYPDILTSWHWEFGDGGSSANASPTHTYADDGVYVVSLEVEDDDGSTDSITQQVTIENVAPVAYAGDDKEGFEVSTFTFDGSFYDPGTADTHTFEWDFDYDGSNFDIDATGQSVSHTWTDDFDGYVALRVTDDDGGMGIDTAHVLVKNVPPTIELEVLPIDVNASLRIAGEKWHDVTIELYEDGIPIFTGSIVRYPGSPDDQMLDMSHLRIDVSKRYAATVRYTPEDDPVNGQPNGATPCWIILTFNDGQELWLHHTFNVQHPEGYVWEVDLTAVILSHGITFKAIASDPGADGLTIRWDFGDGTSITNFYPNPNGTYPVSIVDTVTHAFPGSGSYTITVTVEDDDGGMAQVSYVLSI
jgi:PKD repeat protein